MARARRQAIGVSQRREAIRSVLAKCRYLLKNARTVTAATIRMPSAAVTTMLV
jgi:hypothetical protein